MFYRRQKVFDSLVALFQHLLQTYEDRGILEVFFYNLHRFGCDTVYGFIGEYLLNGESYNDFFYPIFLFNSFGAFAAPFSSSAFVVVIHSPCVRSAAFSDHRLTTVTAK